MSEAYILPQPSTISVDSSGKSALITGAASGIGRACAARLAQSGAAGDVRARVGSVVNISSIHGMVAFLCTPAASFINGASLTIDGGATAH